MLLFQIGLCALLHVGVRLADVLVDAADGLLEVLVGVGKHQTQIPLAHRAEGRAGHADDVRAADQLLGEL